MSGWWLSHPSEKYEFVNWDDDIPNIWENKKWQPDVNIPWMNLSGWTTIPLVIDAGLIAAIFSVD